MTLERADTIIIHIAIIGLYPVLRIPLLLAGFHNRTSSLSSVRHPATLRVARSFLFLRSPTEVLSL
jgi:hypothetical protein